ncbi:unnamed protein product [Sphagnum jensenii]|uniref:Tyr recombinase domain-containing protein n=1 Tax=Sphagnum jensenii TaxID=128206 RepID=A0ABP0VIH3_9BRYO
MTYPFQSLKTANLPPQRQKNVDRRVREYLSHREVEELRKAARKDTRHGLRNDTLILMMFRHGLRVSEIASLQWQQVDLKIGLLHVKRLKKGIPSTHPLRGLELRVLRQLARDYPDSPYIFVSERRSPLSPVPFDILFVKQGRGQGSAFLSIPTCSGIQQDFILPTRAWTLVPFKVIWDTQGLTTLFFIRHLMPTGSMISFQINQIRILSLSSKYTSIWEILPKNPQKTELLITNR